MNDPKTYPTLGEWMLHAACYRQGIDPNEYFMVEGGKETATERAKQACESCTVRASCLAYALDNRVDGYWAGTTTRDRWRIRQAAKKPK